MAEVFDTLLLLALPGSGKSEVRHYLSSRSPEVFHMGPTVQLDDYPYVHLQLCVDEALVALDQPRAYHAPETHGRNGPFYDPLELCALVEILNEDYHELREGRITRPDHAGRALLDKLDAASVRAGTNAKLAGLTAEVRAAVAERVDAEARAHFDSWADHGAGDLTGKTIVIEFARGGPAGAPFPLPTGYGYLASLSQLSPEILERASVLYLWVTPEESQRKNKARHRPDGDASILFHTTPASVMETEYGTCDMDWLAEQSSVPGTLTLERDGATYRVPFARFDNRVDLTSFLRDEPETWRQEDIAKVHGSLKVACDSLWKHQTAR
jgi:hypothetical protein